MANQRANWTQRYLASVQPTPGTSRGQTQSQSQDQFGARLLFPPGAQAGPFRESDRPQRIRRAPPSEHSRSPGLRPSGASGTRYPARRSLTLHHSASQAQVGARECRSLTPVMVIRYSRSLTPDYCYVTRRKGYQSPVLPVRLPREYSPTLRSTYRRSVSPLRVYRRAYPVRRSSSPGRELRSWAPERAFRPMFRRSVTPRSPTPVRIIRREIRSVTPDVMHYA